jgi:hypothetical protein
MEPPAQSSWRDSTPSEACQWLSGCGAPFWIAGGWALDLHIGRQLRDHGDLDVGCFREDLPEIQRALLDWRMYAAIDGVLHPLDPENRPSQNAHSLWCHPPRAQAWWLEIMLEEREGDDWVFRRCRSIRRPVGQLIEKDSHGTPRMRAEIQLLLDQMDPH